MKEREGSEEGAGGSREGRMGIQRGSRAAGPYRRSLAAEMEVFNAVLSGLPTSLPSIRANEARGSTVAGRPGA
jgi:hypothetical protein